MKPHVSIPMGPIRFAILVALMTLAVALLCGCSGVRPPEPAPAPPPTVADDIRALGQTFLRWGGLVLGLGMVIRGIIWAAGIWSFTGIAGVAAGWISRVLGPFVGLGAVGGGLAVAFGACCVWLADYLPIVVVTGIAAVVALGVYYWPRIRRWIPRRTPSGKDPH